MIWFCHDPIHGKPCGMCRPCYEKIDSNMAHLLPAKSVKRNKIDRRYNNYKIYRLYKRIMRKTFWK